MTNKSDKFIFIDKSTNTIKQFKGGYTQTKFFLAGWLFAKNEFHTYDVCIEHATDIINSTYLFNEYNCERFELSRCS